MWAALSTFVASLLGSFLLQPKPRQPRPPVLVRPVEEWSWDREYRRLWHNGPSAFWLEPTPKDVQRMIEPHLGMFNELGRRLRRIRNELDRLGDEEMGAELLLEIAAVSRELDELEEVSPEALPLGWGDRRFGNQISFTGFVSMGGRSLKLENAVPLPVYRLLRDRGLGPEDGYEVHSCREDLSSEELIIEVHRGDRDFRVMRVSPLDLQMSMR